MHSHLGDVYAKSGRPELARSRVGKILAEWKRVLPADVDGKIADVEKKVNQTKHRVAQKSSPESVETLTPLCLKFASPPCESKLASGSARKRADGFHELRTGPSNHSLKRPPAVKFHTQVRDRASSPRQRFAFRRAHREKSGVSRCGCSPPGISPRLTASASNA